MQMALDMRGPCPGVDDNQIAFSAFGAFYDGPWIDRQNLRSPNPRFLRHTYSAVPSSYSADMVSHFSSWPASVWASCERSLASRVAVEGSFS